MNNLLSYCGLVDSKIRASDKDLPVKPNFSLTKLGLTRDINTNIIVQKNLYLSGHFSLRQAKISGLAILFLQILDMVNFGYTA